MTNCKLFFLLTVVIIVAATSYIVYIQIKYLNKSQNLSQIDAIIEKNLQPQNIIELQEQRPIQEPHVKGGVIDNEKPEQVRISIQKNNGSSSAVNSMIISELNGDRVEITSPKTNKIQIKNLAIITKQQQQIIKENFIHTNYMDAIHVVCTSGLLITCIIERTECIKSIEETYNHINRAINNQIDTKMGNVILIMNGSLNIKRTIGHKFTFHSTHNQQIVEFPCSSQQIVNVNIDFLLTTDEQDCDEKNRREDAHNYNNNNDDNISIIANETLYGFNSKENNTKFRQTIKDTGHTKYFNHFRNIIFP